jgi:EpsI family protein
VANVLLLQQLAFMAMVPSVVWALLGPSVVRRLWFPLAYLVFAVPWGAGFVPLLQDFTAAFSVKLLELTKVPVYWEGRMIDIPSGSFRVAEACSGIRYLIASIALGSLYAYIMYRSTLRRLLFIAASAAVPILANGLRAYGIIMLAHITEMRLATGVDHVIYGWVFFSFVMILLFALGWFWREDWDRCRQGLSKAILTVFKKQKAKPWMAWMACGLVLCIAAAGPAGAAWLGRDLNSPATNVVLPAAAGGWQGPLRPARIWEPGFRGADQSVHRVYREGNPGVPIHVLVIHYQQERQGRELVSHMNSLHGEGWSFRGQERKHIEIAQKTLPVRELRLRGPRGQNRLIWSWYDIGGRLTTHPWKAKLYGALNKVLGTAEDATLVAIASDFESSPGQARELLRIFIEIHSQIAEPRGVIALQGRRAAAFQPEP